MTSEFDKRVIKLLAEESLCEPKWWWLSFATEEGFVGAMCIKAKGFMHAARAAKRLESSLHGEIKAVELPTAVPGPIARQYAARKLDWKECAAFDREMDAWLGEMN